MNIPVLIFLTVIGLALLKMGAGWFVDGSANLARKYGISPLTIGITIVAFGTSAPELVVNILASADGNHDIITGNIIGSNIFNLFLILSILGIMTPLKLQSGTAWREIPFSFIIIIILFFLANDTLLFNKETSEISRTDGIIMLAGFLMFLYFIFRSTGKEEAIKEESRQEIKSAKIIFMIITGLVALIAGGRLVLDNSVKLAQIIGLSDKVIGLTIVAAGTSLPELATSIVAIIKKNRDIAVGNIIGSNIFNILFILSVSSVINPVSFNLSFNFDIMVLAAGTLILFLAMYTGQKKQIDRWEAFILLSAYITYMFYLLAR